MYFLQQWFNLSKPGVEEALYDSVSMRRFAGIDLGEMPVPDESTVLRFRHLLEAHGLGEKPSSRCSTWSARARRAVREITTRTARTRAEALSASHFGRFMLLHESDASTAPVATVVNALQKALASRARCRCSSSASRN